GSVLPSSVLAWSVLAWSVLASSVLASLGGSSGWMVGPVSGTLFSTCARTGAVSRSRAAAQLRNNLVGIGLTSHKPALDGQATRSSLLIVFADRLGDLLAESCPRPCAQTQGQCQRAMAPIDSGSASKPSTCSVSSEIAMAPSSDNAVPSSIRPPNTS